LQSHEPSEKYLAKEFDPSGSVDWSPSSKVLRSRKIIEELLDVYLDTVHPM
jgi:hypothetical protein